MFVLFLDWIVELSAKGYTLGYGGLRLYADPGPPKRGSAWSIVGSRTTCVVGAFKKYYVVLLEIKIKSKTSAAVSFCLTQPINVEWTGLDLIKRWDDVCGYAQNTFRHVVSVMLSGDVRLSSNAAGEGEPARPFQEAHQFP